MQARRETRRFAAFAAAPEEGFPKVGLALCLAFACAAMAAQATCAMAAPHEALRPALAATTAVFGAAFGGILVPAASSAVLADKEARLRAHNSAMQAAYARFKRENPGREPSAKADRSEDALSAWRRGAASSMSAGTWPREWAQAYAAAGGAVPSSVDAASLRTEAEHFAAYREAPTWVLVAASAAGCAAFGALYGLTAAGAASGLLALGQLARLAAFGCMAVAAACDARAKVLPFGLSWAMWALAAASALLPGGCTPLQAAASAALCAGVLLGVRALMALAGHARSVGAGDLRTAPAIAALCTPPAAMAGLACAVALQGLWGLAMVASGRMRRTDAIPMGPFLALWMAAALALGPALGIPGAWPGI